MKTAEEIFNEHRIQWDDSKSELENVAMAKSLMLKSMREYASQAIDRCAEEAEVEEPEKSTESMSWNYVSPKDARFFNVDKKSILKIKQELK